MSGGLIQLVALGVQDTYLVGEPQVTFWKLVYFRHTNFVIETIEQLNFKGLVYPGARVSITVSRDADLLYGLYLQYNPSQLIPVNESVNAIASNLSNTLIDTIELQIGETVIDRHYGKWLTIWNSLTELNPYSKQQNIGPHGEEPQSFSVDNSQQNYVTKYQAMSYNHKGVSYSGIPLNTVNAPSECYIPLQFWFCRNPGLALPLLALQYHEVTLNIYFNKHTSFIENSDVQVNLSSFKVFGQFIYLDTKERKNFTNNQHEYLIEQLQLHENKLGLSHFELTFNNPVKEIIFAGRPYMGLNTPISSSTDVSLTITLNNVERFSPRNLYYFTRKQIRDNHKGTGDNDNVGVYSFALKPEYHQPSGTLNFSSIDKVFLVFTGQINPIDIYAINYNILRIGSGTAITVYSN
jgi:hypothetical protein